MFDVIDQTRQQIAQHRIETESDVRQAAPLVKFSEETATQVLQIKRWLFKHLYRHLEVTSKMDEAQTMVRDLFASYLREPARLPESYAAQSDLPRAIADYIAGMTDRFAQLKWRELQSA